MERKATEICYKILKSFYMFLLKRLLWHHLVLALLLLLLCHNKTQAQLIITPNSTAQQLVDTLAGGGVTVLNPTFGGAANSRGVFTTGPNPTNLGISSGIIMSSGNVIDAVGPNNMMGTSTAFDNNPVTAQHPHLAALVQGIPLYDVCYLEFDFIPESDTVEFRYVFASEEYPTFVGTSYNDVFAFFITGPNPAGGNYDHENIALVPGTNLFVAINNVNAGFNSQYYVNNHAVGQGTVEYNGFTTVLTARAYVIPCETYTLRLTIGDAGDAIYDSAVFLEAQSFASTNISMDTEYTYLPVDSAAIRGCSDAIVTFTISDNVSTDLTIPFLIGGSAVMGVDYQPIPDSVVIPAGQNSATVVIEPIYTGQPDPIVDVILYAQTSVCSPELDSLQVLILPNEDLHTEAMLNDTTIICNDDVELWIEVAGGVPPYTYEWDNGVGVGNYVSVNPITQTVYTVTVTDDCGQVHTDQVTVNVIMDYGSVPNDTLICAGDVISLTAEGGISYLWSTGDTTETITVQPTQTTTYSVTIYDGCEMVESVVVEVQPLPVVTITPDSETICEGKEVNFIVNDGVTYLWSSSPIDASLTNQINQQSIYVTPQETTTYTVELTDSLGCVGIGTATINISPSPVADFIADPEAANILDPTINFIDNSIGAVFWEWLLGDGSTYSVPNFQHVFSDTGRYSVNLWIENDFGCRDSITGFVTIHPNYIIYVPSAFTPDGDYINDVFYAYGKGVIEFEMLIFDRWGKNIFTSNDINKGWDGRVENKDAPKGVYGYVIEYVDVMGNRHLKRGTVTLIR